MEIGIKICSMIKNTNRNQGVHFKNGDIASLIESIYLLEEILIFQKKISRELYRNKMQKFT